MASGAPVIAYGEGGALETVTDATGVIFKPQTADALIEAVRLFEREPARYREAACRARAAEFSKERFQRELKSLVDREHRH
jgi:glycosyltransferase involved in cell wall biosynthesis